MATPTTALERLRSSSEAIARICVKHHVSELSVFGSTARGDVRPGSDVDLLVTFQEGARVTVFTLVDMQDELERLVGCAVDLVPKDGLKAALRSEVLAEARVLYVA